MMDFFKDKKKVTITIILILLLIFGIMLWRRRRKTSINLPEDKEESGYVAPRGFFPGGGGGLPTPTPTPSPSPIPHSPSGRFGPPSPMTPPPTPPTPPTPCTTPPCPPTPPTPPTPPYPPYPYYPGPIYYNPFPATYIIDEVPEQDSSRMSREEYIDYLRKRIVALENAYDKAISDFRLARAFKISKEINRVEAILDQYLGI